MSFLQPLPSCGGEVVSGCCPNILVGYCLNDGTPIAITLVNGVQTTWTNLTTGVVTAGPPPAGTGICPAAIVKFPPLTCETDSISVCQGDIPWDIRPLVYTTDSVSIDIANASVASAPSQTVTGAAVVVLPANAVRRSFTIQNTGTVPVYISFGAVNPTATSYHFALSPGIIANDGKGSFYVDDQWTGDVRAFSSSAGSLVLMEIT